MVNISAETFAKCCIYNIIDKKTYGYEIKT